MIRNREAFLCPDFLDDRVIDFVRISAQNRILLDRRKAVRSHLLPGRLRRLIMRARGIGSLRNINKVFCNRCHGSLTYQRQGRFLRCGRGSTFRLPLLLQPRHRGLRLEREIVATPRPFATTAMSGWTRAEK
jgi:hypothetical protein